MADDRRTHRVAAAIRQEVATFLTEGGGRDPRLIAMVTVTAVDVTRDLKSAKIYVSLLGSDTERATTMEGLAATTGQLRGRVGRALRLRVAPELTFKLDESVARAARIESLLAQVREPKRDDEGHSG
jgi:ribosome-binding factor A